LLSHLIERTLAQLFFESKELFFFIGGGNRTRDQKNHWFNTLWEAKLRCATPPQMTKQHAKKHLLFLKLFHGTNLAVRLATVNLR